MEEIKYNPGDELLHKATLKRCVVIKMNDDGTVKVRTEDDEEHDYHAVELRSRKVGVITRGRKNLY